MNGVVRSFDVSVGLGQIEALDGTLLAFHCIAIADGSRSIEVGASVEFSPLAKLGRYEATDIRTVATA